MLFYIFLISFLIGPVIPYEEDLVDYYLQLIQKYSQAALKYELPTNARMYEAKDTEIRGTK